MKLHSTPHRPRSILAGLLALTLMFSMLPTAFAAQQNSYSLGAKVSHKEKHWTSTVANNVWEPGVYGWEEVTDAV